MRAELAPAYYPKVPIWRRGAALAIDFVAIGMLSLLLARSVAALSFLFILGWLAMRVILVSKNRGQSLGRWALDMKVVDARIGGTPTLLELSKREAVLGLGSMLLLLGLMNFSPGTAWAMFFFIPVAADCSLAWVDQEQQRAFHDQISRTRVVQTRRGYSLDLKLKRLVAYAQRRMK
jgi:uncharacterized RDD family membrane protein YckC